MGLYGLWQIFEFNRKIMDGEDPTAATRPTQPASEGESGETDVGT